MSKNTGSPTADSSTNRNVQYDAAYLKSAEGEIGLAVGDAEEAVRLFDAAYRLKPNSDALEPLAAAHLAAGGLEEAARLYEKLIAARELGGESQEHWFIAHLRLAKIQERLGRPEAARPLYERLLSIWKDADPDLPALREARDGLARLG